MAFHRKHDRFLQRRHFSRQASTHRIDRAFVLRFLWSRCFTFSTEVIGNTPFLSKPAFSRTVANHPLRSMFLSAILYFGGAWLFKQTLALSIPEAFEELANTFDGSQMATVVVLAMVFCFALTSLALVHYFDSPTHQKFLSWALIFSGCIVVATGCGSFFWMAAPLSLKFGKFCFPFLKKRFESHPPNSSIFLSKELKCSS